LNPLGWTRTEKGPNIMYEKDGARYLLRGKANSHRLPALADVPRTEVHFIDTADAIGPLGAYSMSESPFNPVAPAYANALRDATGLRFTELPLTRDRVWLGLETNLRPKPASPRST
jgi:CO/xanthine dehydrogenase Mo-binding subunit